MSRFQALLRRMNFPHCYLARGQGHDNVDNILFGLLREEPTFERDEMTSRFHPLR